MRDQIDTSLFKQVNDHAERMAILRQRRDKLRKEKERRKWQLRIGVLAVIIIALTSSIASFASSNNTEELSNEVVEVEAEPIMEVETVIIELPTVTPTPTIIATPTPMPEPTATPTPMPEYTYDEMKITEEELWYYRQVTMAECYDYFTEEEMLRIASVIRNRIEDDWYPDTVIEVVTQAKQFAVYGDKRYLEVTPNEKCIAAVDRALKGDTNIPEDILFFCTVEYYEKAKEDNFFKTNVVNVPEYNFRNVMMFRAK